MEDCRGNYLADALEKFKRQLGDGVKDYDRGFIERFEKFAGDRRLRTVNAASEKKYQVKSVSSKAVAFCLGIHKFFLKKRMKTIRFSFMFILSLLKEFKKNLKKSSDAIENKSYKEKALKPANKYSKESLRMSLEKSLSVYIKNKRPGIFAMFLRSMIKSSLSSVYYKITHYPLNIIISIIPTPCGPKPLPMLDIKRISLCYSLFNVLSSRLLLTKSGVFHSLIHQRPLNLNISIVPREPVINLALTLNPIIKPLQPEVTLKNHRISIGSTAWRLKTILSYLSRSITASAFFKILNPKPLSIEVMINPYKFQEKKHQYKVAANLMKSFLKSAVKSLQTAVLLKITYVSINVNVSISTRSAFELDPKHMAINNFYSIFSEMIKKNKRLALLKVIYCPPPLINLQITYKSLFGGVASGKKNVSLKKSSLRPTILAEIVEDDEEFKHNKDFDKKLTKKPKILFRATKGDGQKFEKLSKCLCKYKKFAFEILKKYLSASFIKKRSRLLKKMLANFEKLIFITKYINFSLIRDAFFFTYNKLQHFSSVLSRLLYSHRSKLLKKSFFRYRSSVFGLIATLFFSLSKAQIHSCLRFSMQTMLNYIIERNNYFFYRDTMMHSLLSKIYFKRISYTLV